MGTTRKEGSLYTRLDGGLAILEFGHPSSNSLNSELLSRLCKEIESLGANTEIALILIQSEGDRAFCAGASFDELLEISTPEQSTAFFNGFARLINSMRTCPIPIIGKVHGKAVGGGVGLIASCDYVMASDKASLRLSEIGLGIAPLVIAPAVERKAGVSGLAELALAPSEWKSAYWARERGLFSKVFESRSDLDKETEFFAADLASHSRDALMLMKRALWEGTEHWDDLLTSRAAMTGKLALSQTTQQTISAFKKKR
ncbi:enoyl-CoA hydratase/isomerase family protein [Robiginitalea aurantiaca]|uniref:Enoyl-CoA hydratase/isomerase family protein n=1 Tax=Robiginitalea aurantiaca TaxID=3056915 RepID=A0ABT7WE75_9FLAO|nr:enoyl-CoA hydratase/isomerase family protein [Robiginitalea aurantiaca]MDM9631211.1 enoyl-CoA hydratase/isomerase family protein [Robiginitalea aurantiaca]